MPSACVSDTVTYLSEVATVFVILGFAVVGLITTLFWISDHWGREEDDA